MGGLARPLATLLLLLSGGGSRCAAEVAVYSVADYGAKGDGVTDNTASYSTLLSVLAAGGGGRMYFPPGVYEGRIEVPAVDTATRWMTVEIAGDIEPTPTFGTVGKLDLKRNGTILQSRAPTGPAVISVAPVRGSFSGVYVVVRNLNVRTYDNPAIGGVDLAFAQQCKVENVVISTDVYDVEASEPTHGTSGLVTPGCNNGALTLLRNVGITGYNTGLVVNEHTDGDAVSLYGNVHGASFAKANHASRFGRLGTYRNAYHLTVMGGHGFSVQQLAIENAGHDQTNPGNAWQALKYDINDPSNLGAGDVSYWVVLGNFGPVSNFTKDGGVGIQARRVGSAPACDSPSNPEV